MTCKAKPKYRVAKTHRMPCRSFLQVIFRKRATKHGALWREMTYKDKASYDSTPPCISRTHFGHTFWLSQNISLTRSHILVETNTGWRRPIGCLKLQIIFRKRATNYRALLRNMSYTDKTSCKSSPPCMQFRNGTTSLAIYGRRTRHCLILSEFAILCFVFLHTHTHTQQNALTE